MNISRPNHAPVLAVVGTVLAVMTGLVIYSPTLYRMFCAATGYNGTVQRATAAPSPASASGATVDVAFDANVAPGLAWEFRPMQSKVTVQVGEPTKVYYYARNNSDHTEVARAVFNVTPYQAASYFFKVECFCFTNEKLAPGESAEMPLVFYVDEQMLRDKDSKTVSTITLSYTFYRQTDLSPEEVAAARDLHAGSLEKDATLRDPVSARYENDAPRQ